ncbi:MAG: GLPGLI family protein [Cellulophaga sp.]
MGKITKIILIIFLFSKFTYSQSLSGIVKYSGAINKTYADSIINVTSTKKIPSTHKDFIVDMYKNAKEVDLFLHFKNNESYYYLQESLEEQDKYNTTVGAVSTIPYYRNAANNSTYEISKYVGIVKRTPLDWKITNKTKKIGKYVCNQALATETLFSRQGHYYTEKIEAWFTTEIPVSFGPKLYTGLPGLVLEVNKNKTSITATEINLNPTKGLNITVPNLNKIITQEQANKKWEELAEASKQRRKK